MGWQWHQLDHMQVICTSLQTDNHASTSSLKFLRAGCPSCSPTNSVKALKECKYHSVTQLFHVSYIYFFTAYLQCFDTVGWEAGSAYSPQKNLSVEVLAWLSVWSEVLMTCIWSSWCHCHPHHLCFRKIQNGLSFRVKTNAGCISVVPAVTLSKCQWDKQKPDRCYALSTRHSQCKQKGGGPPFHYILTS